MREILFRGKRKTNGKWIYGDYFRSKISNTELGIRVIHSITFFKNGEECSYTIDPDTLGQYTGMTDQNGKKMFENDIVLCTEPLGMGYREIRGKVAYKLTGFVVDCGKFNTTLSGGLTQSPYYVVGNIHDNPELLDA